MFSILEKLSVGVLGEGFIGPMSRLPSFNTNIWNGFEKFRTGPIGPVRLVQPIGLVL